MGQRDGAYGGMGAFSGGERGPYRCGDIGVGCVSAAARSAHGREDLGRRRGVGGIRELRAGCVGGCGRSRSETVRVWRSQSCGPLGRLPHWMRSSLDIKKGGTLNSVPMEVLGEREIVALVMPMKILRRPLCPASASPEYRQPKRPPALDSGKIFRRWRPDFPGR